MMARILITGSSDGLGSAVAQRLVANGHSVGIYDHHPERHPRADAPQSSTRATPNAQKTPQQRAQEPTQS